MSTDILKYYIDDGAPLLDSDFMNKLHGFCDAQSDCYVCPMSYATGFRFSIGCYIADSLSSVIGLKNRLTRCLSKEATPCAAIKAACAAKKAELNAELNAS